MYTCEIPLNIAGLPSSFLFNRTCTLQVLDLDDNQISEVRADAFRGMDSLSEVWLYGNRLTTLEVTTFTGLPRLAQSNTREATRWCVALLSVG